MPELTDARRGRKILTARLPCVGNAETYDALFEDGQPVLLAAAQAKAAALCARCSAPCPDKVTVSSGPRTAELLPMGWLPPTKDGRPQYTGDEKWHGTPAGLATYGCQCWRCQEAHTNHKNSHNARSLGKSLRTGGGYVPTDQRVAKWAQMAADLNRRGRTHAQIAEELYVTEDTARALLAHNTAEGRDHA